MGISKRFAWSALLLTAALPWVGAQSAQGSSIQGAWQGTILSQVVVTPDQANLWLGQYGVYFSSPRPAAGHGQLGASTEELFSPLLFDFGDGTLRLSDETGDRQLTWKLDSDQSVTSSVRLQLHSSTALSSLYLTQVQEGALLFALMDESGGGLTLIVGTLSRMAAQ